MEPNHSQRDETRRLIVQTATQIIVTQGADAFSMRMLAQRVNRSPAALYRYFANREAILEAVRDLALQQLAADFLVSEQEAPNEMEKVRAACRTLIQFGVRYPRLYMLIYEHTDGGRPDYKTIFNTFHFRYMRDKLKLLERAGLLNMPEGFTVELLILQLWTCIHGILAMRQNLMADEPIFRKVSERLVDQMLANLEYPQDQWQILPSEMES